MGWSEIEDHFENRDQIRLRNEYRKIKRHEKRHADHLQDMKAEVVKLEVVDSEKMKKENYDIFALLDEYEFVWMTNPLN
jgi:hypothetical protein